MRESGLVTLFMNRLVIIADDLTGAADTAACFAQGGLATVVKLDLETADIDSETGFFPENPVSSEVDVLSLSTGSRELSPQMAVRRVEQALGWLGGSGFELPGTFFYKKIDSMLRGHPALELAALMDALGLDRALVAPAFPAQGRVTRAGWQVISDSSLPLWGVAPAAHHRRGIGKRRSNLDCRINLAEVFAVSARADTLLTGCFAKVCTYPVYMLPQAQVRRGWQPGEAGIYLADAETEDDLDRLAQAGCAWRAGQPGWRGHCSAAGGGEQRETYPHTLKCWCFPALSQRERVERRQLSPHPEQLAPHLLQLETPFQAKNPPWLWRAAAARRWSGRCRRRASAG